MLTKNQSMLQSLTLEAKKDLISASIGFYWWTAIDTFLTK